MVHRRSAKRSAIASLALATALAAITAARAQGRLAEAGLGSTCAPQSSVEVAVRGVGIHLDIALTDGRMLRLRGLRAPRGTRTWPELAAMARAALDGWITGSRVLAEIAPGPADRWGRHAARLWLPPASGQDNSSPGDSKPTSSKPTSSKQRKSGAGTGEPVGPGLIEAGWAQVDPETAPQACLRDYFRRENAARQAKLGLWSDASYQPVPATDLKALTDRAGSLAMAEGTVISVNQWKMLTFLNFSRRYSDSLSVMLTRRARQSFEQAGIRPESLKDKRVRVRGLLELSNGKKRSPRMRLQSPRFIEILP